MSSNRSLILGLFFLISLSVLAYYTLFLTDFTLFREQPELRVHFSQTNGLREGDAVLVAGMRWGRVKKLTFDPTAPIDRRIVVLASLNEPLPLREGFVIKIEDATLLGGRNLSVDPGPAEGTPVPADRELFGQVAANPIAALGKLVDSSEKGVADIVENIRVVTADLRAGKGVLGRLMKDETMAQDLADSLSAATKSLGYIEDIARDLRAGHGSAGQFLVNESLFKDLSEASHKLSTLLDETNGLAKDVRSGKGLAGTFVQDEALAKDLTHAVADLKSVIEKINNGQGTIGQLVNDDEIAKNVATVTRSLASGEGTIGALLVKPDVYDNMRQITEDFSVVSGALRSGQGSIGRLVMDDDLYQDLKTAVRIVQRSLEEFREAAPITTFTTVFFGAF
jgi:phospholipid/cholesterol/gamma-HCH transport system substrate-binding protein